jgi:hypothetical protein
MPESSEVLLSLSRELISQTDPVIKGLWPRATALVGRQALEVALEETWSTINPSVTDCSVRAQLLCLIEYVDEESAEQASLAWWAFTRACHHHPYELAPTFDELSAWLSIVDQLRKRLNLSLTSE